MNKALFDFLFKMKESIEDSMGNSLIWERMDENVSCKIKHQLDGVNIDFELVPGNQATEFNNFLIVVPTLTPFLFGAYIFQIKSVSF